MAARRQTTGTPRTARRVLLGRLLAAAGLAFVAAMTLEPMPELAVYAERTPVWCLVCGSMGVVDVVLNVLLFVPLGAGLRLAGLPRRRVVAVGAAATLAIELLQLTIVTGRDASLSDLLTNTAGAALGAVLADLVPALWRPDARLRRRVTAGWAALWLGLLALTATAHERTLPRTTYWGQWAPELAGFDTFPGRVLEAEIDGRPLPWKRLRDSPVIRHLLLGERATLSTRFVVAGPTARTAPIVSVFDENQDEIVLLGQDGLDLVFRLRTRAAPMQLRTPMVRLAGALAGCAGDTVRAAGTYDRGRLRLELTDAAGATRRHEVALAPTLGWALLIPYDYAFGREVHLLTALWVAGLLAPLGFWGAGAGSARDARRGLAAAGAVALLGLGGVAAIAATPWPHAWHWLAAVAGLLAGAALARLAAPAAAGS